MDKKKTLAQCDIIDLLNGMIKNYIKINESYFSYCKYNTQEAYYKGRISAYKNVEHDLVNKKIDLMIKLQKQDKERGNKK